MTRNKKKLRIAGRRAALGADFTFDDAYRVGINLNVGGGSASSTGDFNKTKNSFSFWGLGLYGGWKQGNYALSADLGYTATDSNITQSLPSSMQMNSLKADVKNQAFTVGMRAEYKLESSAVDITPLPRPALHLPQHWRLQRQEQWHCV